ncbi:hypothetical protein [Acetobacter persici]|uniref:Uncharacterized protein n=1 Tax=Acetobacter persici TaxID=1076596 RepID=A0A1U9LK33_9PROT|nr:hypothetical protein [Acetobacter persici]AQT06699.1 hypothetical protein A0U91_16995 [Acetobacter persici]
MQQGVEQTIDKTIRLFSSNARCALEKNILGSDADDLPSEVERQYRLSLSTERAFDPLTYALAEAFGEKLTDHRKVRTPEEKGYLLLSLLALKSGSMTHEEAASMENWLSQRDMLQTSECVSHHIAQVRAVANTPLIIGASKECSHIRQEEAPL